MALNLDQSKYQCCKGNISDLHQGIKCVKCFNSYHPRCVGFSGKNRQEIQKIATIWHCCQGKSASSSPNRITEIRSPTLITPQSPASIPQTPQTPKHTESDGFQRLEHLMLDVKQTLLEQLSELRNQISNLTIENKQIKEELQLTQSDNISLQRKLFKLETEVDYLKEKENINNIVISGIPDKSNDPLTVTLNLLKTINSTASREQIYSAQYIGKEAPQSVTANNLSSRHQNFILVKLTIHQCQTRNH